MVEINLALKERAWVVGMIDAELRGIDIMTLGHTSPRDPEVVFLLNLRNKITNDPQERKTFEDIKELARSGG